MTFSSIRQEIRDLRRLRRWLALIFILSIILPIPIGGVAFYELERDLNKDVTSFWVALEYAFDAAIGTKLTNITATSFVGGIVFNALAILKLVFFGFVSSIIMTTLQICMKSRELSRLEGAELDVH